VSEYVAVLSAGFEGAEAARIYRALADFALSWAAWTRACRAVDQIEDPRIPCGCGAHVAMSVRA
jgi:hypothetical protein